MLAPEFLPVWGGVGTYIIELVRHLPNDVEVHVVTPLRAGFGEQKISSSDYDLSEYFHSNVHVHFVSKASDTFLYNAGFQYACLKHVPRIIKDEHIDLIHSHTAHMPDLLLQYRGLKTPFVTTIHTTIRGQRQGTKDSGMSFSRLEFSEKFTYLAYPLLRLAETVYFSRKRYYITVSNWMKEQITKEVPKIDKSSISVIHNSVDVEQFLPNIGKSAKRDIILFTGRIIAAKGICTISEAMPKVLRLFPDALFVFIGAGNSELYQRRLRMLGIPSRNFLFMGYLKDTSDLASYYKASSVYLAPSLYENLPIRILEAMACGVPVVASSVCAIPEVIDNGVNGMLIKPGSVNDLSNAICCLLRDPCLRKKMGENARKTVLKRFNWRVNASRTFDVYQHILNNSD